MEDVDVNDTSKQVVTIRASEWLRGGGSGNGALFELGNPDAGENSRMCCLGIDAVQRGVNQALLLSACMPSELSSRAKATQYKKDWAQSAPAEMVKQHFPTSWESGGAGAGYDLSLGSVAASINDDDATTDEEKIAQLRPMFNEAYARVGGCEIEWKADE